MRDLRITENELKEYVEKHDVRMEVLTPKEIEEVREEVAAIKRGEFVMDSCLENPELFFRK